MSLGHRAVFSAQPGAAPSRYSSFPNLAHSLHNQGEKIGAIDIVYDRGSQLPPALRIPVPSAKTAARACLSISRYGSLAGGDIDAMRIQKCIS